jgi:geranylgeranyl pyrophosphate synthase
MRGQPRGAGAEVPAALPVRERLRAAAQRHGAALVPPVTLAELQSLAAGVLAEVGVGGEFSSFTMVLLYNAAWRATYAAVPFNRRLLLLPPCMRSSHECPAVFDELGLVCRRCGRCEIGPLADEAERLGYAVLVAEGTSVVTTLIESGQLDAAMGVSCMAALERSFPHMAEQPVPSLAIPLVRDGCADTATDMERVREALRLRMENPAAALPDMRALHAEVVAWFGDAALKARLGLGDSETETISLAWLAKSGKRWRPFLTASVYAALQPGAAALPESVQRVALAVECIHKASLVYDDIQDEDGVRYDEPTMHEIHGIPIALNAGLDLLGHGYRLIAECGAPAAQVAEMLALATRGHCELCIGQGSELCWGRNPRPLAPGEVLEMFRRKTAPSFVVVFGLGAILGGASAATRQALDAYSEALGVAYQIRDDLEDFRVENAADDIKSGRASLSMALAHAAGNAAERQLIEQVWREGGSAAQAAAIRATIVAHGVEEESRRILVDYKTRALAALVPLTSAPLKTLLHRIAGRVLGPAPA